MEAVCAAPQANCGTPDTDLKLSGCGLVLMPACYRRASVGGHRERASAYQPLPRGDTTPVL